MTGSDQQKAVETIKILNMNEKNLLNERKGFIKQLKDFSNSEYLQWLVEDGHKFKSIIEDFIENDNAYGITS